MDLNLASAVLQGYDARRIFAALRRRGGCDQTPSREGDKEREESESGRGIESRSTETQTESFFARNGGFNHPQGLLHYIHLEMPVTESGPHNSSS
jgi:hypothetical protein